MLLKGKAHGSSCERRVQCEGGRGDKEDSCFWLQLTLMSSVETGRAGEKINSSEGSGESRDL